MIEVIHVRDAPRGWQDDPLYVYIGRPKGMGEPLLFGNPFEIGKDGTRPEVLDKYRTYLYNKIHINREFREQVKTLQNRVLVCFCKPKACHGDILAEFSERLNGGSTVPSGGVPLFNLLQGQTNK